VYRVLDDRLTHDVAIRASNSQFMGRFTHEPRTIASPNHADILPPPRRGLCYPTSEGDVLEPSQQLRSWEFAPSTVAWVFAARAPLTRNIRACILLPGQDWLFT